MVCVGFSPTNKLTFTQFEYILRRLDFFPTFFATDMGKWQFPPVPVPLFLLWPLLVSEEEFFSQWFIGGEEEKRVCSVRKKNGRRPSLSRPAFWRLVLFTIFCKFFPMLWIHTICDQKLCDWLGNSFHFFFSRKKHFKKYHMTFNTWLGRERGPSLSIYPPPPELSETKTTAAAAARRRTTKKTLPISRPNSAFPSFLRRKENLGVRTIVRPHNKPPPPLPHLKR